MTSNVEKDLVDKLKSSSTSEIYETLVKIRKSYVRNQDKMKKLQKHSVIKLIIPMMEHPKFCNISLSIIADGCLDFSFANEVIKCDGPKALMRIMKSCANDDIHNRACRALGNIAKFEIGFKAVHIMKPISNIINFLSETNDVNCQQTAVRTLTILGKSSKTREVIAQENGFIHIGKLLNSSNVQVLICSIKAIANLTYNCTMSCARQLLDFEYLKVLVNLHSHTDKSVRNHALISLKNLSSLEEIRSELVKVGAVKLFTEVLSACESHEMSRYAALALCKCLDHIHMWSHNGTDRSVGLKALLAVLKNKNHQDIHISVLASLIPLSYEFNVTDILLNLDVLQILIEILDNFIKNYQCKSVSEFLTKSINGADPLSSNSKKKENGKNQLQFLTKSSVQKLSENDLSQDCKNIDNSESMFSNPTSPEKSPEVLIQKSVYKWDSSLYGFTSVTSDYSGSCSPSGTCSPPLYRNPASPEFNYNIDIGSPSTANTSSGVWSPSSLNDEGMPWNVNCWSPVVSTHSNSPVQESELVEYDENVDSLKKEFLLFEKFNETFLGMEVEKHEVSINNSLPHKSKSDEEIKTEGMEVEKHEGSINSLPLKFNTDVEIKTNSKCLRKTCHEDSDSISCKRFKKDDLHTSDSHDVQFETVTERKKSDDSDSSNSKNIVKHSYNFLNDNSAAIISSTGTEIVSMNKESKGKDLSCSKSSELVELQNSSVCDSSSKCTSKDSGQPSDLKLLNENVDRRTIDRYIILFIFQISFHIEKKPDSHMAKKSFFSVLIDYLCLIHKPSLKAETVLSNLIKNRYCLEKLILNGFFSELEEKMTVFEKTDCTHHSHVLSSYSNLINVGRHEVQSDYGIGTLSRILITSKREGQLHAICALSDLVTKKRLLYKLLVESSGLSLLLEFLSDSDNRTKKKAVISLHKIYTSLTKKKSASFKCCFKESCTMETSPKCCYKESFLNVTFVVSGGAKILANREKVCENSDYFRALLQGHFRESNSEVVVLPNISAENLATIFHFLHGCGNESTCPYITRVPFSVLLELLSDCEKFLLLDIKSFIEDRLCHCLSSSQIPKVYKQSKLHNSPALANRVLNDALKISSTQKDLIWNTIKELLHIGSCVNVYSDIKELIETLLL